MQINKKFFQNIFKTVSYGIFKIFYKKVEKVIDVKNNSEIQVRDVKKNGDFKYQVFALDNARLYTDRINDTAVILKNEIVEKASFQFRVHNSKVYNADIKKNIVFSKGTPRLKKKVNGEVLSLLTGGGGNNNYWHWLFDVMPRIAICEDITNIDKINFFLLPSNKRKYQKESFDLIISLGSLEHCFDINKCLKEIWRVLKKKGKYWKSEGGVFLNGPFIEELNGVKIPLFRWIGASFILEGPKEIISNWMDKDGDKYEFNPDKAVTLLEKAGYQERNSDGFLVHNETKKVLSFTIEVNKSIDYRVTPMQQILKEYGIDMQIKFIDATKLFVSYSFLK